ncbi:cytidine deaminase-like protein [Pisolithus albus]|nr:cytidine deaminase-like protein [Pisolithus albus]
MADDHHGSDRSDADSVHVNWMRVAMTMAEEALAAGEVPVGCVFVRNGEAIAKARNRTNELHNASRHAELEAVDLILANNDDGELTAPSNRYPLSDTTLYVTVEPCIMCASALRQLGIKQVFYGCENDKFGGCGSVLGVNAPSVTSFLFILLLPTSSSDLSSSCLPRSSEHPVHPAYDAIGGFLREEAIMILRRFYVTQNTNAPVPRQKGTRVLKTEIPSRANSS